MNWIEHIPILVIIIPLLAAPLCLLANNQTISWFVGIFSGVIGFSFAVILLNQTIDGSILSYSLGGWNAPLGIELKIDLLNAFVFLVISFIALCLFFYCRDSIKKEIDQEKRPAFYAGLLLIYAGLVGITLTGDVFNAFVFLEISSLSSYAVISMGKDRRAFYSAFQYLIMGTLGATFFLIGIGFIYAMTGTLNMSDLAQRLDDVSNTTTVRTGIAFIFVGLALKLAMFPLHLWLPNTYTFSPSVVSIFLAATSTKVAIYLLLRMLFMVFGVELTFSKMHLGYLLIPLSIIAILSASLVAIFQSNLKRMMGYSSVAQIGYMLMGLSLMNITGLSATLIHIFNHALMKGALFMALGAIFFRLGTVSLNSLSGIGRLMPWTMGVLTIGGMSLVGFPLTAGFISKWFLVTASIEAGLWWLVPVVILGSLLAAVYIWRMIEVLWIRNSSSQLTSVKEAPIGLLLPAWVLALANIYFGIDTSISIDNAENIAIFLLGSTQ
tara:strand:- start:71462 stop:72946 length:1485 start_codon:yes stop_codon:yes gene_type:complete